MMAIADLKPKFMGLEEKEPRRAFFVVGAEGSGTYMLAEALVAAGCHYEEGVEDFKDKPSPFVFRRSSPHNGDYIDINHYKHKLRVAFDKFAIIFVIREPNATKQSVLRRDSERDVDVYDNQWAIFHDLGWSTDAILITYSAFVHSEGFRRWLFEERLALPYPEDYEVTDQNAKYYR